MNAADKFTKELKKALEKYHKEMLSESIKRRIKASKKRKENLK
jgi:hypothetical protein